MSIEAQPTHPVVACADAMLAALAGVRDVQAVFMSIESKKSALLGLAKVESAVAELKSRVLAASSDVAEEAGARDVAGWLAHATRDHAARTSADLKLAMALDSRPVLASALAAGMVNVAQARVIVDSVADLPEHLGPAIAEDALARLIGFAGDFGPRELRRLGRHILDVVAPRGRGG